MKSGFRNIIRISVCVLFITALYGGYIGTLSWFENKASVDTGFKAESAAAYFASGIGTEDDPYVLNNKRHFYNLCWLQYLGKFNNDVTNDDGAKTLSQYYFKIDSDIDCDGLYLPPIGTTKYPFVGHIERNDHVISNYTITNDYEKLEVHPSIIDEDNNDFHEKNASIIKYCSIIGTFGVVGPYKHSDNNNLDGYTFTTGDNSFTSINSINDFYVNDVIIKPYQGNRVLAGLLAGYVNANMNGCGVHYSNFEFKNNSSLDTYDSKISKYGLIGDYNSTDYSWDGHDDTSGGSGSDATWGGSIDMRTLNRRLNYIMNGDPNASYDGYSYFTSKRTDIKLNASYNYGLYGGEYYWKATSYNNTLYLMDGTCIPLNVDVSKMGLDSDNEIEVTISNLKLHNNSVYQNATSEVISNNNTGYLVSYSTHRGDSWIRSGIRTFSESSYYSGIPDSFIGDTTDMTYDDEHKKQFALYTIQGNTTYCIIDDVNKDNYSASNTTKTYSDLGLVKYKNVRDNFDKTMNGAKVYHGFHFMNHLPNDITTNLTSYISTQSAYILGTTYDNYEFIKGGLNFTVEKDGYITAIVGAGYASKGQAHSLFDLYKAERDENQKVTSLTRIKQVYTDSQGNVAFNAKPSNDYSLNIDIKSLASTSKKLDKNAAYYFEIPVTAGDYVIGVASDSGENNAYFMYLDIGANGGSGEESDKIGALKNVDFYYYENGQLVKVTSDNQTKIIFDISGNGSNIYYFRRVSNISVLYFIEDTSVDTLKITPTSSTTATAIIATSKECN